MIKMIKFNKTRYKQLLYGLELRITAIITNGLVHCVPKIITLKEIKKELLRFTYVIPLTMTEFNRLWTSFVQRYVKVSKQTYSALKSSEKDYKEKLLERQDVVYNVMSKSVLNRIEHDRNVVADEVEQRIKRQSLNVLTHSGIFYLCSTHVNPAKDHADYEGKVYVSTDWEKRCTDKERKKVAAYIKNHKIQTIEWVTGAPVYMIFRPNCKHYFIKLDTEEVLSASVRKLLRKHDMYMPDEVPMSKEQMNYKHYYEKTKALQYLREMCPSKKLDDDIKRSKKLTRAWKNKADVNRALQIRKNQNKTK